MLNGGYACGTGLFSDNPSSLPVSFIPAYHNGPSTVAAALNTHYGYGATIALPIDFSVLEPRINKLEEEIKYLISRLETLSKDEEALTESVRLLNEKTDEIEEALLNGPNSPLMEQAKSEFTACLANSEEKEKDAEARAERQDKDGVL